MTAQRPGAGGRDPAPEQALDLTSASELAFGVAPHLAASDRLASAEIVGVGLEAKSREVGDRRMAVLIVDSGALAVGLGARCDVRTVLQSAGPEYGEPEREAPARAASVLPPYQLGLYSCPLRRHYALVGLGRYSHRLC